MTMKFNTPGQAAEIDFNEFIRDRDEALLSLDRDKIEAYCRKYECPIAPEHLFWVSTHKARTAITSFPEAERQKSLAWLKERGLSPMGKPQ